MTKEVTIDFDVTAERDIPRVGHRKMVRLNGRPEVMWVKSVDVRAERWEPGVVSFVGTATLKRDLWA